MFLLAWQICFAVSDAGLAMAIIFFYHFFRLLFSLENNSPILNLFVDFWPKSVAGLQKLLHFSSCQFTEYVVCPKCHSLYEYKQCVTPSGQSKLCKHAPHRQKSRQKMCGAPLLTKVKTQTGFVLRAKKVYYYQSLISSLEKLLSRPGFVDLCE